MQVQEAEGRITIIIFIGRYELSKHRAFHLKCPKSGGILNRYIEEEYEESKLGRRVSFPNLQILDVLLLSTTTAINFVEIVIECR